MQVYTILIFVGSLSLFNAVYCPVWSCRNNAATLCVTLYKYCNAFTADHRLKSPLCYNTVNDFHLNKKCLRV